jgi:hypothetical protein
MNKKVNTLLFILGATVFNVLTTLLSFVLLAFIYGKIVPENLQQEAQAWPVVLIFIAAIAISFVVYRYALRLLMKKVNLEKYFDPIVGNRRR